jgi:hypothetical protein
MDEFCGRKTYKKKKNDILDKNLFKTLARLE